MDDSNSDFSISDFGISIGDIQWLSEQLVIEYAKKNDGELISPVTALQKATGCSYTAARMWLIGKAVPRRAVFIDKIISLIDSRYPRLTLRITKADLALFELIASELEIAMGPHGSHLASRLRDEIVRCKLLMNS